jgi:hypothetical protein
MNKTQNQIIVIAGDSWACGEWRDSPAGYRISHSGLSEYLSDSGYLVVNLGQPGGNNINSSANRVATFLQVNTYHQVSKVIIFQTEWIRDITHMEKDILAKELALGYLEFKMKYMDNFYRNLSVIACRYNVPIYLIGGCSDTAWSSFANNYPGVHVICQSFTNLLLTNNHRIETPVFALFTRQSEKDLIYLKQNIDSKDLKLLLDDMEQGNQRITTWKQQKSFFWPDGAHANQIAHGILFEFLKTQIPDL